MSKDIEAQFEKAHSLLAKARTEIGKVIYGQDDVVDKTLITLICGGHGLLIGVPGLAKTLLVDTAAKVLGLQSNRIQCTPDLMPSDILGSEILDEDAQGKRSFRFVQGPVFTEFLMADEINRASPRTQSALLQAMQEKEVAIAGKNHKLPEPFHVMATQNPIEHEGTYPLPEAQLDRFLMQIDVEYPDEASEREIVVKTTTNEKSVAGKAMSKSDLIEIQSLVRSMPIGEESLNAVLSLVRRARPGEGASKEVNEFVYWAPGPRASQALMMTARAKALMDGRSAPSIDDVIDMAEPVLKHRMGLNYKARAEKMTLRDLIRNLSANL